MRSWRPFCSGWPAAMRSRPMPSFSHHTDNAVSPPAPIDAKGEPLSERITLGRPYSFNTRSICSLVCSMVGAMIAQHSRNRL